MEQPAPVAPPVVARPFRLLPFVGRTLSASWVGHPASQRAFAAPLRQVPRRSGDWSRARRLDDDDRPALYAHEYTASGVTVRGLVGALDLEGTSAGAHPGGQSVFPHEGVHERQVDELAERMHRLAINPAPILLAHRGGGTVEHLLRSSLQDPPSTAFTDQTGQVHRVWALRAPELLESLGLALAETRALIADGHHRHAAYLRLRDRYPDSGWRRGLVMLVDQDESPLWLGAIHRHLAGQRLGDLVTRLSEIDGYRAETTSRQQALDLLGQRTPVLTDHDTWVALHLPESRVELAVATLDDVLDSELGVSKSAVGFHHTVEAALAMAGVDRGVSILMPAPSFDRVATAAVAGELLPEKATSFQPKPTIGVLIRRVRDE